MTFHQKARALFILIISSWMPKTAQQSSFKKEFLKKWKNATTYTLEVAEKMPASKYGYRPNEGMRTFGEQMEHIGYAMTYLSMNAIHSKEIPYQGNLTDKDALIDYLKKQFEIVRVAVEKMDSTDFEKTVSFWAGRMTRRKILNIAFDHTTHTRAQAIVYLRLQDIKPPQYIAW